MDRRQFLAAGGLAAVSPVLAQAAGTGAMAGTAAGLFEHIDFTSDGLGLGPREYATLLHDVATTRNLGADYYSIGGPVTELERRKDHEMVEPGELERLCGYAREQGIRLHLDGARMFNLPFHSGRSVRDYAALFDTVYVSLWKHFNGASGAILAGDAAFIDGLFHLRRMFGGAFQMQVNPTILRTPPAMLARIFTDSMQA